MKHSFYITRSTSQTEQVAVVTAATMMSEEKKTASDLEFITVEAGDAAGVPTASVKAPAAAKTEDGEALYESNSLATV